MNTMRKFLIAVGVVFGVASHGIATADPQDVFSIDGANQDAGYLHMIRVDNGIPEGQDDTLVAYAHEWCAGGQTPSGTALIFQQGFPYGGIYIARVAASKYFCPQHVAVPPPALQPMQPYPYGM